MSIYKYQANLINGQLKSLQDYEGKALLIVNTATQCGFTPQLKTLQDLHQKYQDKDFLVLGFPCNQFGKQEPGANAEVAQTCELNYGVQFPLFEKIEVNGSGAHPLFQYLKNQCPGLLGSEMIKWNFTKFLVNKEGIPIKRYAPKDTPEVIEKDLVSLV